MIQALVSAILVAVGIAGVSLAAAAYERTETSARNH